MLDLRYVAENSSAVQEIIEKRHSGGNALLVADLYRKKNLTLQTLEQKKQERNTNGKLLKQSNLTAERRMEIITLGKELKASIAVLEAELEQLQEKLHTESLLLPNLIHPDSPVGMHETDNILCRQWGNPASFERHPLDHVQLCERHDLADFETATKVSATKFYYLKNEAVLLELALIRYALEILKEHGFTLIATPDLVKEDIALACGYNPRGNERDIYRLEEDNLCLIGTSEIPLAAYYAHNTLDAAQLPIHLAGISHCFRREAGAAGKVSRGLYRVHQFSKVEMFTFSHPHKSQEELDLLLAIEEKIMQGLEIPYRVMDVCSGELGAPAYRKYDIEAWMPARTKGGSWGEVTSASNCAAFQSRRLNIRYKEQGNAGNLKDFVHTLNGTALAVPRILLAILENFQMPDASISIPPVLQPFCGITRIPEK